MFNYCAENNKNKALLFILENNSEANYNWLSEDKLSLLNSICDVNSKFCKYKPLFIKVPIEVEVELLDEDDDDFCFDWEAEDDDHTYNGDDEALKGILKAQDSLLSSVTIVSSESDLLNSIDVVLPTFIQSHSPWSKFILKNKKTLQTFYTEVTFDDKFFKDELTETLSLYFEELDVVELSQAIELSFFAMHSEHEIDFSSDCYSKLILESYFICDAESRFDEWLVNLDSLIEEWKKPKLSNPIFKYYFHMLGEIECQPLVKEDELKVINSLQTLTYQVVNNESDIILDEIVDSFNESFENPYILLSEEQQSEIQSTFDKKMFISTKVKNKEIFLRPTSIGDYVRNCVSNSSLKQLNEMRALIHKFQLSNLRLVVNEANKYQRNFIEFYFDMIQEGNIGLLAAINRFDPSKGHKFSTYATWWIKQSISRFIDINCSDVRAPIHYLSKLKQVNKIFRKDHFDPSVDIPTNSYLYALERESDFSYLEVQDMFDKALWKTDVPVEDLLHYEMNYFKDDEDKDLVSFLFDETDLSDKEAEVIKKRFGINRIDSMTLEEVGEGFNLTRERIRQIESNALKKLRAKVNSTFKLSIDNSRTSTTDKAKSGKMIRDKSDA
jgi:RNA polymerase primary sigma factor